MNRASRALSLEWLRTHRNEKGRSGTPCPLRHMEGVADLRDEA